MKRLAVTSTRGGTGKSTLTALLARGLKVGVVDLDIHGPNTAYALGLETAPAGPLYRKGGEPALGCGWGRAGDHGLPLQRGDTGHLEGREKLELARELLRAVSDWGDTEWLCVDTPQGEELMAILEDLPSLHGAVLVTQPSEFSTADCDRLVDLFREAHSHGSDLAQQGDVSFTDAC